MLQTDRVASFKEVSVFGKSVADLHVTNHIIVDILGRGAGHDLAMAHSSRNV
ncbi:hypothetical protein ES702_00220 [subsurface metagenome]